MDERALGQCYLLLGVDAHALTLLVVGVDDSVGLVSVGVGSGDLLLSRRRLGAHSHRVDRTLGFIAFGAHGEEDGQLAAGMRRELEGVVLAATGNQLYGLSRKSLVANGEQCCVAAGLFGLVVGILDGGLDGHLLVDACGRRGCECCHQDVMCQFHFMESVQVVEMHATGLESQIALPGGDSR